MENKFVYKNAEVLYRIYGDGKPVMLVHGFGEDGEIWNIQKDYLQNICRLIIPDLPGSGQSAYNTSLQSIDDFADCMNALLEKESISKCIMLGHSMGGYITLSFAEKYADKLDGFGLIHSTAFEDSKEKKQVRQRSIESMEEYGAYAFLKNTIPNFFSAGFKKNYPEKMNELIERGNNFSVEALQQYYKAMMQRPDTTNVLIHAAVPVLFTIGTEDQAAPMKDVLQQVHLPARAYINILENTAHLGMWESAKKMNEAMEEFITDVA